MKKKVLNGILFGGVGLLALSSVAAVSLTSCSTTTPAQDATINLYNAYNEKIEEATNGTNYVTKDNKSNVTTIINDYYNQALNLQKQIQNGGTVDEKIWIDSVVFQIKLEKSYVDNQVYLLGAPIGGNILSAYTSTNPIVNFAIRRFDLTKLSGNFNVWTNRLTYYNNVIDDITTNLKDGAKSQITLSGIMLKSLVNETIKQLYKPQLEAMIKNNGPAINTGSDFKNSTLKCSFFEDFVNGIPNAKISSTDRQKLLTLAQNTDKNVDAYVNYLLTEYWTNVKYGWDNGATQDQFGLSVVPNADATGEKVNIYPAAPGKPTIKGLGLTQADLNAHDIGIGFTPGQNGKEGLNIYQNYLLLKNTNLYTDASKVNGIGRDNVGMIKNNMKQVDLYLAKLLTEGNKNSLSGNLWIPEGYNYNSDIFQDASKAPIPGFETINGVSGVGLATQNTDGTWDASDPQLANFFEWLNSEQWFFGRDALKNQVITLPSEATNLGFDIYFQPNKPGANGQGELISENKPAITNSNFNGAKYSFDMKYAPEIGTAKITKDVTNNFGDAGNLYLKDVVKAEGIKPGIGGASISGAQAYAGASFSMDSYYRLRDSVLPSVTEIFVKSADSNVHAPTELNLHTNIITGVDGAAYAEGRDFYLDTNPYEGVQKWTMTTLLSHESLPGHNLQMIYAVDNTSSKDAPSLNYTAYAEGWGLFSEWLATQYGAYGQPKIVSGNDWLDPASRLQLPDFDDNWFDENNQVFSTVNINVKEANSQISNGEFMNGIYETDYNGTSTTSADTLSQGYYNATQYFGFLNERQLRAMRMVLDTSIHAGGPTIKNGVIQQNSSTPVGKAAKGSGWSLQDEYEYMAQNSALGQGDRYREAQRYLNYAGQATSYLTGELEIEDLFGKASAAYAKANENKQFMDYANLVSTQNNTAPFFNLILRNNDIPLPVLKKYVTEYIQQNIGAIPETSTKN